MLPTVVAGLSLGFTPPGAPLDTGVSSRRAVLSKVFGGAALLAAPQLAGAVKATTGLGSRFTGDYDDPMHPGCMRTVKVVGAKVGADGRKSRNPSAYITGYDGPADPRLARLNGEVESAQKALSEAEAVAKVGAGAAAEDEAAVAAAKAAEAKVAEAKQQLASAEAARDKVASAKRACSDRPEQADVWRLDGKVAEDDSTITIDFSPKGGPARLLGTYENLDGNMAIVFPDGNRWTKVVAGTPDRKPKELKTLSTKD